MIVKETIEGGLTHTYSDAGYRIRQLDTGVVYDDAIDILPHEYEETDERVDPSLTETLSTYLERQSNLSNSIAPTESIKSSDNYAEGSLVIVDGILCRVTIPIVKGEPFVIGGNVTPTNLTEEIQKED